MAIQFACPWCTQTISVDDSKARERVECPYCNRPVKVPTESTHDLPPPLPLPSQNMEDPPPSRTVPKRRWLGVLLSLFVPGFGLVCAGCVRRGVVWFFALYLLGVLSPLLFICARCQLGFAWWRRSLLWVAGWQCLSIVSGQA